VQYRNTSQKQMVFNLIDKYGHLTSFQIKELLRNNKISLATIYRNLVILEEEHRIKKVSLGIEDVYESIKENHYHFICDKCKIIEDIPTRLIKIEIDGIISNVKQIDMVIHGICQNCKEKEK